MALLTTEQLRDFAGEKHSLLWCEQKNETGGAAERYGKADRKMGEKPRPGSALFMAFLGKRSRAFKGCAAEFPLFGIGSRLWHPVIRGCRDPSPNPRTSVRLLRQHTA